MCIAGRLPYCKRFPTSTGDFLGTVSGTWSAFFVSLSSKLPAQFEGGWKPALCCIHSEMKRAFCFQRHLQSICSKGHLIISKGQHEQRSCFQLTLQNSFGGGSSNLHFLKLHRKFPGGSIWLSQRVWEGHWSLAALLKFLCLVPFISFAPPFLFSLDQPDVTGMGNYEWKQLKDIQNI